VLLLQIRTGGQREGLLSDSPSGLVPELKGGCWWRIRRGLVGFYVPFDPILLVVGRSVGICDKSH
jgi:hypothetical protein